MDRLSELEEKKRQLKELREKRSRGDGKSLVAQLLQGIQDGERNEYPPTTVSVSIQTDAYGTESSFQAIPRYVEDRNVGRDVITYDKTVQTSDIPTKEAIGERDKSDEEYLPSSASESPQEDDKVDLLPPLLMEDQRSTVQVKSFSMEEVLNDTFPRDMSVLGGTSRLGMNLIHRWTPDLEMRPGASLRPVCIDSLNNLVAVIFQSIPTDRYNVLMTPWSYLYVLKWDSRQVVDKIEYRGQIMTKVMFLRKDTRSNVVSILVTSHTGKTVLQELRFVEDGRSSRKLERNIISQNIFAAGISALGEYRKVPPGHERFIAAGVNGVLNELSSLDLAIYVDPTSSSPPLSNIKVVPPRPSELVVLGEDDEENEGMDVEARLTSAEKTFRNHLLKVSLLDCLAITSIALSPSDSGCIYIGTEDGGIYKLFLNDFQESKLKIQLNNNDLLPVGGNLAASENGFALFHSSHVTALSHNGDELLLSASLDWTCALWDLSYNSKLAVIDVGSPIIDADWLEGENHLCAILTWDALFIVKWEYHPVYDTGRLDNHWKSSTLPKVICKLSPDEASGKNFTSFKTFKDKDLKHIIAVGCDNQEISFYRMAFLDR